MTRRYFLTFAVLILLAWAYTPYHLAAQDLQLEITADRSPVVPGTPVVFSVVVSNTGGSSITGADVDIQLPAEITGFYASSTTDRSNVTCSRGFCNPGETATWSPGELSSGEDRALYYRTSVQSSAAEGTFLTNVEASASSQTAVNASVEVTINDSPVMALGLAGDPGPVAAGDEYVYRLDYGALVGAGGADDATLSLELPAGVAFQSATGGGTESSGTVTWNLGIVEEGYGNELVVTGTVDDGLSNGVLLMSQATLDPGNTGAPVHRSDHVVPVHSSDGPFQVLLSATGVPSVPGTRIDFVLTASSQDRLVSNAIVQLILPRWITSFRESTTTDGGNVSCSRGFCNPGEKLTWTVGELEAGQSKTLLFGAGTTGSAVGGDLQRLRGVASASRGEQQMFAANYGIDASPVMALGLAGDPGPVAAGAEYVYRLDYGALDGAGGANDATLRLELPAGVAFQSATGGGTESGGTVTWNLGALNSGDGGERTVMVTVDGGLPDGTLLRARATLDSGNSDVQVARAEYVVPVHSSDGPFQVLLSATGVPSVPGTRIDFVLTASSQDRLVSNAIVQLILPRWITSFRESTTTDGGNVSCSRGFCNPGEKLTWTVGELEAGQSKTLLFGAGTTGSAVGGDLQRLRGVASASRGEQQMFAANYGIDASPVMALGLAGDPGPVAAGAEYVYRLDYGALDGAGGANDATLRLELPAGVAFQSATGGGTESGGTVTWNLGALNSGDGGERTVMVTVDGGLPDGTLLRARATLDSGNSDVQVARAEYVVPVHSSDGPFQVLLSATGVPSVPGTRIDFVLTASSQDRLVSNAIVQLILPRWITSFRESTTTDGGNVSCSRGFCNPGEKLTWTVGELEAGQSKTLLFGAGTTGSAVGGDLQRLRGVASASRGEQQMFAANYGIDASPVMALGLAGDPGPVAAGAEYVYRLDYGALDGAGGANDATLRLELPAGVTFQSATGGGTESGGTVTWNLGALNSGDGGERTVMVIVDGSLPDGALLQARAMLDSDNSAERPVRASYVLAVRSSVLALRVIRVDPPVQPSAPVDYTVELVNNGGLTLTNPRLRFILPEYITSFRESTTTDGGNVSCSRGFCNPGEKLVWTPGDISAGDQRTLGFSTTVQAPTNVRKGDLLRHRLVVDADGAQQRHEAFDLPLVDDSNFDAPGPEELAPLIVTSPEAVDFDGIAPGASATKTLTIENTGDASLDGDVSLSDDGGVFALSSGSGAFALAPGESQAVEVTFAPETVGTFTGTVAVSHNADNASSPVEVSLTGLATVSPVVAVTPEAVDFGSTVVGASQTEALTIANTGSAPLEGAVSLSGDASAFTLTGGGDFSIAPGETQAVDVTFAPEEAASFAGTVAISHNASNAPNPVEVALTGEATVAPPVIAQELPDVELAVGAAATTRDLTQYIEPPATSPGPLAFSASSSASGIATAEVEGSILRVTPSAVGIATIEVTAETEAGAAATLEFLADVNALAVSATRSFGNPGLETSYRLVGLPGQIDADLAATLTGEAGSTWRAFRETGADAEEGEGSEAYLDEYDGSEAFRFAPGRGFWVLSRETWAADTTVGAVALAEDSTTTVPLQDGWNILSNPLDRPVAWDVTLALAANDGLTEALWQWDGSWQAVDTLLSARTGEAYYLFNDGGLEALTLQHPALAEPEEEGLIATAREERAELQLIVDLRPEGTEEQQAPVETARLALGYAAEGAAGGAIMHRLPPAHFASAQLAARSGQVDAALGRWLKARPEASGGLSFDIELTGVAEGEAAYLRAQGMGAFEGDEIVLVNAATGARHDLRVRSAADPVRIRIAEGHLTRASGGEEAFLPLQLLIGDQAFIDRAAERPEALALGPIYPNPSRGEVTIEVAVPEAMDVRVELFNVLGQQVGLLHSGALAAGVHELRWDGHAASGGAAASGVYLIRLIGPDGTQRVGRLTRVR